MGLGVVGSIVAAVEALPSANTALVTLLVGDGVLNAGDVAIARLAVSKRHGEGLVSRRNRAGCDQDGSIGTRMPMAPAVANLDSATKRTII